MQSAETVLDILREITGEPGAGKPARRVREGDAGKGPKGTSPASYLACVRAVQMTLSVTMVAAGWDRTAGLFEPE
jgi:hypothetical protein